VVFSHDIHSKKLTTDQMFVDVNKTYLYESPINYSGWLKANKHKFNIKTIVLRETIDVIEQRNPHLGVISDNPKRQALIAKRIRRLGIIASKRDYYRVAFTGTSSECLKFLQNI